MRYPPTPKDFMDRELNFQLGQELQEREMVDSAQGTQLYRLRTQLLSKGRSDYVLAKTDTMSVRIKCYAQGGENVLHAHSGEDHTFVVLAGEAHFFGEHGEIAKLSRNEGILLPEGAFYRFQSCGDEPLILMRVGAINGDVTTQRLGLEGESIPGTSKANKHEDGVPIDGLFYE
jgi:mannose-6-phosphate isomerase-like protein (cupin superfamily)